MSLCHNNTNLYPSTQEGLFYIFVLASGLQPSIMEPAQVNQVLKDQCLPKTDRPGVNEQTGRQGQDQCLQNKQVNQVLKAKCLPTNR